MSPRPKIIFVAIVLAITATFSGCTGLPVGITPVPQFELQPYLGTWHEVARLDHSFERGLTRVSAEYSLRDDGGVKVVNRGWDAEKQQWKEAVGKAYFVRNANEGYLKVSFFGPFYGAYVIFSLDADYHYSFISGPDRDYLWFLSRTPDVPQPVMRKFMAQAAALGFDTDKLIILSQQYSPEESR